MQPGAGLTEEEKRVAKALLDNGASNQDVHALINYERGRTVNFGRISSVKKDERISAATASEVEFFKVKKRAYDPVTGLNRFTDERLIRAREAMILAVTLFNGAGYRFKTEIFSVLANIAWTYLLHERYERMGVTPLNKDGTTFALYFMLHRADCDLSKGIKNNLTAVNEIRNQVEHKLLGSSDYNWLPLFQACCLNFDKTIVSWFGQRTSVQNELSVALQFGRMDIAQLGQTQEFDIPAHISSLDANLLSKLTESELNDVEYKFKVIYTFANAPKGQAHIKFIAPNSDEAKEVQNVLEKFKIADELYKYKPTEVAKLVSKLSGRRFLVSDNTFAWKRHKARPDAGSAHPEKTNREYCIYHPAYRSYTYNDAWVKLLVDEVSPTPKLTPA